MAQDPYKYFRVEAHELVDQLGKGLLDLEKGNGGGEAVGRLLRLAHTLKGAARVVRQPEIADHAHAIEDALSPLRGISGSVPAEHINATLKLIDAVASRLALLLPSAPDAAPAAGAAAPETQTAKEAPPAPAEEAWRSVRAESGAVDGLIDGIGETYRQALALSEAEALAGDASRLAATLADQINIASARGGGAAGTVRLDRLRSNSTELRRLIAAIERTLAAGRSRIERELAGVRETAEQLRLVPAATLFTPLERVVRDAASALRKTVLFSAAGGDVRVDADTVRTLQEALLQLVRNAVAHGIEPAAERSAAGKPEAGEVKVLVTRRGRFVAFRVSDDGRGIDAEALRRAAAARGVENAARLSRDSLIELMLKGGISTSAAVTEVSGRGIGMDIVREAVERLGGQVAVQSDPGKGTSFDLAVPLSLSAMDALSVEFAGGVAAIPLDAVRHTLRLEARDIYPTALGDAIVFNGGATPIVRLSRLLSGKDAGWGDAGVSAVVIEGAGGTAALAVDRLHGSATVVVRALPTTVPASPLVAGAALDAAGNPRLVLDPDGLIAAAMNTAAPAPEQPGKERPILVVDDSLTTRMLEQSILESAGYSVDVATSAEEALVVVRRRDYALILVDVEMPGMDGFGFVEAIRADPDLREIPAILVTSRDAPEDRRRGIEAGAQAYVVKSEFNQSDLLATIRRLAFPGNAG